MFSVMLSEAKHLQYLLGNEQMQILRFALQKENAYVFCFLSVHQGQPLRLSMLWMTSRGTFSAARSVARVGEMRRLLSKAFQRAMWELTRMRTTVPEKVLRLCRCS